ncbi:MAG: hypothetical protein Q8M94_02170 [Ignavibacteria bacterium]|nr:hypothetical protein [Ignavibacteria bacterium]
MTKIILSVYFGYVILVIGVIMGQMIPEKILEIILVAMTGVVVGMLIALWISDITRKQDETK